MANIFGQKELTNKVQIKTEKNDNVYEKEAINIEENKNEINTVNGGSMIDYFKRKSNYNKNFSSNVIDDQAADSESEKEQYVGFGFTPKTENVLSSEESTDFDKKSNYAFDNPCLRLNSPTEIISFNTDNTCKKSAKKRKKEYESDLHATETDTHNAQKKLKTEFITGEDGKDGFTNPALNLDIKLEEDCNGKEFEVSRAQFGLENCGLDLTDETSNKKCVTFNDHITLYEYNIDSAKKKKGKATLDKFEVENKKHKKKRKQESITTPVSNGFVNEALDIETVCEEINDNEMNEHKSKKTKKRKIRKISNLETIQESPEHEKQISEIKVESEDVLDSIVKNEETNIIDKKLKKKKKKNTEIENITVIDVVKEELDFETEEISGDKKIRKHKKNKEEIVISKKYKQEKKDKKNCTEECAIKTEAISDQEIIEISDEANSEQQENDLIMEKKDATEIESVITITKEEEETENIEFSQISSSWNTKMRMSKKMLVTLFRRNELLDFPGSNIRNIKGYAVDI